MAHTQPFNGTLRKLVVAFDVGTTFSGIAYAVLDPDKVPKIQAVTRFPGQENGDFKIPSILWYTQDGKVHTVGAEARHPLMELAAEDEDLVFVDWFKLHLRPAVIEDDGIKSHPLPPGKTVINVFADFLAYLFSCTKAYIVESHANGASLWESFGDRIEFVLSHPNGWEGSQQSQMRKAAIEACLVPDTSAGHERVHFVSEGEADLHYCIDGGLASHATQDGASVIIIDAGGGTIDLSTYQFLSRTPIRVEEITPAGCIFQGSITVNARAEEFLEAKLKNSKYGNQEDIKAMMEAFEKTAKPTFKNPSERSFIKFGSSGDRDPDVGIRSGQLPIDGSQMAQFFQPSVDAIVQAVRLQRAAASRPVALTFLVGGYAASPWLFAQLSEVLPSLGLNISRPDNHTNKAVAEGSVSFYLKHFVAARIARLTYGTDCSADYNENDPEHHIRRGRIFKMPSGRVVIPEAFCIILQKGTRVRDQEEKRRSFVRETLNAAPLNYISADVMRYRGKVDTPKWVDTERERYTSLCTVTADTSRVAKTTYTSPEGAYFRQLFDIVLLCGMTEMKAYISWMEDGVEKRGAAKIVYDDDAIAC